MIFSIGFDTSDFNPGETGPLSVNSDTPVRVRLRCFTFQPLPPDYKPCDACGVLVLNPGDTHMITADRHTFAPHGGELRVRIEDTDGDVRELLISVRPLAAAAGGQLSGTP